MTINIQKASLWKRISAWAFDIILTITIALGFAVATSSIVDYDHYNDAFIAKQEYYEKFYEEKYNIDINPSISDEEFENLPEDIKKIYSEADRAFSQDPVAQQLQSKIFYLSLLIISISAFLSIFVWYFVIPLLFRNGQTLGKKCFSIGVMRTNSVKISNPILFVRSMLGLYAIETMVPLLMLLMLIFGALGLIALIVIGLMGLLQVWVMISSKTNSSIHDLLSDTVVIDMSTQTIFENEDALIAYKESTAKIEAEQGNGGEYTPINLFDNATYLSPKDAEQKDNEPETKK